MDTVDWLTSRHVTRIYQASLSPAPFPQSNKHCIGPAPVWEGDQQRNAEATGKSSLFSVWIQPDLRPSLNFSVLWVSNSLEPLRIVFLLFAIESSLTKTVRPWHFCHSKDQIKSSHVHKKHTQKVTPCNSRARGQMGESLSNISTILVSTKKGNLCKQY